MSRLLLLLLLPVFLLSACGSNESWEKEEVTEVSHQILAEDVKVEWKVEGSFIQLKMENKDGKPVEKFKLNHEKLLHLIIVSKDLSYFNHIHPEYKGKGIFEIRNDFPAGGEYKLVADFKPVDGGSFTKTKWVNIEGPASEAVPITVDDNLEKTVDGKRVTLSVVPLEANKELTLKFSLVDEKMNQLITDLEPYLGAIGHVVILSEDGELYLHVHATEGQGSGPEALFETEFPKSGVYKIWGQFQKDDHVFTVSYVVNVR
ncbi:hypothetical protein [Bacillus salipaludis]|uniref:Secreted protein n=1 Tax=Bacillus salipaludis TaxID=2547811 RepID=A0ABW8RB35_9BACI